MEAELQPCRSRPDKNSNTDGMLGVGIQTGSGTPRPTWLPQPVGRGRQSPPLAPQPSTQLPAQALQNDSKAAAPSSADAEGMAR